MWYLLIFEESSLYSEHKSFVSFLICKYFISVCSLSFHSLDSVLGRTTVFNFDEVQLINLYFMAFMSFLRTLCLKTIYDDIILCFQLAAL